MTLYDIMPPAIFFLSLGGMVVIAARSSMRLRQAAISSSIQEAASEVTAPLHLLRPTKKSVQFVGTRAAAAREVLVATWQGLMKRVAGLRGQLDVRWQLWRESRSQRRLERLGQKEETFAAKQARKQEQDREREAVREAKREEKERRRIERQLAKQRVDIPAVKPEPVPVPPPMKAVPTIKTTLVTTGSEEPDSSLETIKNNGKWTRGQTQHKQAQGKSKKSVFTEAREALSGQQYGHAENVLVKYIMGHTKDRAAYVLLGEVALGREAWDEAIEIFEQVIAWDSSNADAWRGLGTAAFKARKYAKALPALRRAAEAEPANTEVLDQMMTIAKNMDNPALQDAIKQKQAALSEPV